MSSILSYDSNSISTLFSSLGTSNTTLGSLDLTTYAQIRTGSYGKLLKAYYAKTTDSDATSTASTSKSSDSSTTTSKDSTKTLAKIEESAEDVTDAVDALKKSSTFSKTVGSDGTTSYDVDGIYDKVSDFVDSYNALLKQGTASKTSKISSAADTLEQITADKETELSKIGISVSEEDGSLSLDEDTFKKADMGTVKSLLGTTGNYGYQISLQASMMESYAKSESYKSNTYTGSGQYTYNYNAGQIYLTQV